MIRSLSNEMVKGVLLAWSYRLNWFVGMMMMMMIFIAINFIVGDAAGNSRFEARSSMMIGFFITFFAVGPLNELTYGLRNEMTVGTLEQMVMSPRPVGLLLVGLALSNMMLQFVMLSATAVLLMLLLDFPLPLDLAGLPVMALIMVGVMGAGFLAAGLTIVFKHVESVVNILTNLLLFTNGTFVGVENYPDVVAGVVRLLPTTEGIIVMRQVMVDGQSLGQVWADGTLLLLILNSTVFLVFGWLVFRWCERIARRRGTLGQY